MTQRIGILGGLSTAAAARFYERLSREYAERHQTLDCTMVHADITRVLSLVSAKKTAELVTYLVSLIHRLQQGGSQMAVIPAVTPHYCISLLKEQSPLPVLSILDAIKQELLLRGARRVAIFGTRFAMESALWDSLPGSVDAISLSPEEANTIHELYMKLVQSGSGTVADASTICEVAHNVIGRLQVDTIVLAGTDFVVLPDCDFAFPHVEAFDSYVRATVDAACR